jgi:PKD repeat protein
MCQNIPVTITGSSAINYSSILWTTTGTGTIVDPTSVHPTYIAGPGETGVIVLTMTSYSIAPCTAVIIDQLNLTIYPLPGGMLSGSSTICENDTVVLNLTFYGTPPITVTYTNGVDTTTIGGIMNSPYYIAITPQPGTWTYTLVALSDAHCAAPPNQLLGSASITVFALPEVEFQWAFGSQNNEIIFTIDTTITNLGAIGNMILWDFGDGTYGYDSTEVHLYPAPWNYEVTLTVTDTNGCSNSVTHMVNVPNAPNAFFDANDPVCFGQEVCFTDMSWVYDTTLEYITTWVWD